jgi:hypothetical protein
VAVDVGADVAALSEGSTPLSAEVPVAVAPELSPEGTGVVVLSVDW